MKKFNSQNKQSECVAIGLYVWNGERTIEQTIKSLLNQTYKNIKIFILDNKSSDSTVQIIKKIKKIKKNKKKIFLIIDKIQRNQADAPKFLIKKYLKKYKYSMLVGDDDIYDQKFIEAILCKLNKKIRMVYTAYNLIDLNGRLYNKEDFPTYNENNSYFFNLFKFIIYRNLISMMAGIFETQYLTKSFKFYKIYDKSLTNYDNLMLVDFLANNRIGHVNKKLFNYRKKNRIEVAKIRGQKGISEFQNISKSLLLIFLYQFNFSKKATEIIAQSKKINEIQKIILYILIIITYFQKCLSFLIKKLIKIN